MDRKGVKAETAGNAAVFGFLPMVEPLAIVNENRQRNASCVSRAASSLCRETPTFENTRLSVVRAVPSVIESCAAASRGELPDEIRPASRDSAGVKSNRP